MKYVTRSFIGIVLLLVFADSLEAQLRDRIRDRARGAAEDRVEERISQEVERAAERMVDSAWESIFGPIDERDGERRGFSFNMNSNVTTEEAYTFDIVTTMEIEMTDADGNTEPPMNIEMMFNENQQYTGTRFSGDQVEAEGEDIFIIYDFNNSAMIMLMESEEGKFSFAYDWGMTAEIMDESFEEEYDWEEMEEWNNFTRIGTKNIHGYQADGYESRDDEMVMEVWVSREAEFGMNNFFQANTSSKHFQSTVPDEYPWGMLMEMTMEHLETSESSHMRVTDIRQNAGVNFTMSDYPVISFGD